eukprot:6399426-Amphidinium_carterae.1
MLAVNLQFGFRFMSQLGSKGALVSRRGLPSSPHYHQLWLIRWGPLWTLDVKLTKCLMLTSRLIVGEL